VVNGVENTDGVSETGDAFEVVVCGDNTGGAGGSFAV